MNPAAVALKQVLERVLIEGTAFYQIRAVNPFCKTTDAQAAALSNDELVEKATEAAETSEDRAIFRELIGRFVGLDLAYRSEID